MKSKLFLFMSLLSLIVFSSFITNENQTEPYFGKWKLVEQRVSKQVGDKFIDSSSDFSNAGSIEIDFLSGNQAIYTLVGYKDYKINIKVSKKEITFLPTTDELERITFEYEIKDGKLYLKEFVIGETYYYNVSIFKKL